MDKSEIIHEKYFHIDNGGFHFKVDWLGNIEIDFGFHGYSTTTIFMAPNKDFNVKALADFFAEANFKQKQLSVE